MKKRYVLVTFLILSSLILYPTIALSAAQNTQVRGTDFVTHHLKNANANGFYGPVFVISNEMKQTSAIIADKYSEFPNENPLNEVEKAESNEEIQHPKSKHDPEKSFQYISTHQKKASQPLLF